MIDVIGAIGLYDDEDIISHINDYLFHCCQLLICAQKQRVSATLRVRRF